MSYALGEGESISEISQQVSSALKSYNRNFEKLAAHEHRVDMNVNTLSAITENVTAYEKHHYESQIIQSILASGKIRRITSIMQMGSDLTLQQADIESLMKQISDGLLKITPVCQLRKGQCMILSYLTQGNSNDTINLHQVLKGLIRSTDIVISCLPTLEDGIWMMPNLNLQHFDLKQEYLIRENTTFHQEELNNKTWLTSLLRPINSSEITLEEFVIYAEEKNCK